MTFNSSDLSAFKDIWVFCEQREGKLMNTDFELISEGRKLADERGSKLVGVLLGDNVEGIARELGGYLSLIHIYNAEKRKYRYGTQTYRAFQ